MKSYHMLAWKEIMGQKVVSVLILAAIILSTLMTTAVGQSVGVLDAMRRQQAAAIGDSRGDFAAEIPLLQYGYQGGKPTAFSGDCR